MKEKTLGITEVKGAKENIKDIVVYGDGDTFKLLCKASSQEEGWMKSTKVCNVDQGCIVQVTTQQRNPDGSYSVAEALQYVPGMSIDTESEPRKLVSIVPGFLGALEGMIGRLDECDCEDDDEFCDMDRFFRESVEIPVELCREGAVLPTYAKDGDAGMDVYACNDEPILVGPGMTVLVPTGLKMAIPVGKEVQVRPRSGLSLKTPLRVANAPGTIDAGYRDEVGIIITNTSGVKSLHVAPPLTIDTKGNLEGTYVINKGDRIAQIILSDVPAIEWDLVDSVAELGTNRGGGFGHTGVK